MAKIEHEDFFEKDAAEAVQELTKINRRLAYEQSYWRSFGRGIVTGLGASVGAVLILAFAGTILRHLVTVDFIRPAVEAVLPYIESSVNVRPSDKATADLPAAYVSPSPTPSLSASPSSASPDPQATE